MSAVMPPELREEVALETIKRTLNTVLPDFFNGRHAGFVLVISLDGETVIQTTNVCPACTRALLEAALSELPADASHTHGPAS